MKRLFVLAIMVLSFATTSCEKQDVISTDNLPGKISEFIVTFFPQSEVSYAVKEKDDMKIRYHIVLSDGYELEFNGDYNVIDIKGVQELPEGVIPVEIRTYVEQHHSNNFIIEWELDDRRQKIELNNGIELEFNKAGGFVGVDL